MYKKLRKFCAWALAVVTVVSLVPSSGLVMADETDTSVNAEVEQGTIYFKVPDAGGQVLVTTDKDTEDENTQTITVTDEKTTLTDKDGNETDVTLTEEGYSLEITGDVESVVDVEILPAEGYEVGTYHILSDTGDVVDEPEISSENKYEVAISKDIQVVEVLFNAVETQSDTTEETEVVEEPTETEEVTEKVTEPVEETTEETTEESEPVEEEKEAETTSETEDMDAFIEAYMESEERVQKILDENWDLGYSENYLMGIAPNYVGERVYTKGGLGSRGAIDVINYHDPNDWTNHSILNHWTEGILGTSSEWMFCANPKAHFQSGYKTAVNATKYYTQDTITLVAGVNYYVDHYFCSGLDSTDKYFIKQTFVWRLLNDVNHWYTGSGADRIAFEYGNGLKDNQGHWVADHMNGYEDAVGWVTANKSSLVCSGEIFEGSGQPLSRWSCQYNPTGSGDDSDEVSETETSTAINSLSASARAYNIFDHIGQTVNVQTWHQSQDTDSYKISWVNSNGVVKHRSKQGRLGVVSKLQPPGTYNDDYLLQVMWCGDADISMRTGTRVVRDLSTYYYTGYTQTRLKQAAALFYWWDSHYGDKVSSFQNYYVKQAIVWWIKGSSESGKQGNTPYANWDNTSLRAKQKELWSTGLSWAKSNYQYFVVKAVLLTGENQPLFTMTYTYEPTGSGDDSDDTSQNNILSITPIGTGTYEIDDTKYDNDFVENVSSNKTVNIDILNDAYVFIQDEKSNFVETYTKVFKGETFNLDIDKGYHLWIIFDESKAKDMMTLVEKNTSEKQSNSISTFSVSAGDEVTYYRKVSATGTAVGQFKIGDQYAFCIDHFAATPGEGTNISRVSESNNTMLKRALYYGWGGPDERVSHNDKGWLLTTIACHMAVQGTDAGYPASREFWEEIQDLPNAPSGFKVYIAYTQGSYQDLCYYTYEPTVPSPTTPVHRVLRQLFLSLPLIP